MSLFTSWHFQWYLCTLHSCVRLCHSPLVHHWTALLALGPTELPWERQASVKVPCGAWPLGCPSPFDAQHQALFFRPLVSIWFAHCLNELDPTTLASSLFFCSKGPASPCKWATSLSCFITVGITECTAVRKPPHGAADSISQHWQESGEVLRGYCEF